MRIEKVVNTGEYLEISYAEEADIDYEAGVIESRTLRVAMAAVPPDLIEGLIDAVVQILEAARVQRHRVADRFRAPR